MSKFDPKEAKGSLDIFFVKSNSRLTKKLIPGAIDLDSQSDIIGCEIINLKFLLGKNCAEFLNQLPSVRDIFPRFSYDPQVDCCYLQLKPGTAANTEPLDVSAILDSDGRIVRLMI